MTNRIFKSLRIHRNYRLFFAGQVISLAGTWMQNIALAWFVVELTDSPLAVGGLAFCRFLPFMLFGLYAGVIADRLDNRKLVMATQAAQMVVSAALTVLAFSGWENIPIVYVLAFLGGSALVLDAPGRQALTFQMVGRDELPNAIALNTGLFNGSRIIGPAIAGVIIGLGGTGICFLVNTITFLAVLTALALMRKERALRGQAQPPHPCGIGDRRGRSLRVEQLRDPAGADRPRDRQHGRLQLPRDHPGARFGHPERRPGGVRRAERVLRRRRAARRPDSGRAQQGELEGTADRRNGLQRGSAGALTRGDGRAGLRNSLLRRDLLHALGLEYERDPAARARRTRCAAA